MENLQIIVGRLGADPKVKHLPNEMVKTVFSVATTESWKDKQSGELRESVERHQVEVWGQKGENCAQHLKKGRLVYVRGSHHSQSWEKDGVKHYRHFLRADVVKFLDKQG